MNKEKNYKAASSYQELILNYLCLNLKNKEFKIIFKYFVERNIKPTSKIVKFINLKKKDTILDIGSGFVGNYKFYKKLGIGKITIVEIEKIFISKCKLILNKINLKVEFIQKNFFYFSSKKKFDLIICSKFLNIYNKSKQKKTLEKITKISNKYILITVINKKSFTNYIFLILAKFQFLRVVFYNLFKTIHFFKIFNFLIILNFNKSKILNIIFFLETLLSKKESVKRYILKPNFYIDFLTKKKFKLLKLISDGNIDFLIFKKINS